MNVSQFLSLNPLSLMKSTRLFRNFIFMFSLLGLGSFAWGDRYETVFVYTEDTAELDNTSAREYLQSNSCVSNETLTIQEGEIAYVFGSGSSSKPTGSLQLNKHKSSAYVYGVHIDKVGLDSNLTRSSWDMSWDYNDPITNFSSNEPIIGPATVKIMIKPSSARQSNYNDDPGYWSYYHSSHNTLWDFGASEGFVTFRIIGAEQAPSKKFATVIPENASGNVRIVLEQSTDLINWSSANPGVFPPSTSKRFFRVRSVEE